MDAAEMLSNAFSDVLVFQMVDATDAALHVLRERSELFDFGSNAIAFVADGKATPVSRDWLVDHAGRVVEFYSVKTERDEDGNVTSTREIPHCNHIVEGLPL
jgi:hypothetical protein